MNLPGVVEMLLTLGADVNERDEFQRTPLILAASRGYAKTVRVLLAHGADVNAQDEQGSTALHEVLGDNPNPDILRDLLAHGADPNRPDGEGINALEHARLQKRPDLADLLRHGGK